MYFYYAVEDTEHALQDTEAMSREENDDIFLLQFPFQLPLPGNPEVDIRISKGPQNNTDDPKETILNAGMAP
jgi:hypothetical protein